jgi:hypothetical protein
VRDSPSRSCRRSARLSLRAAERWRGLRFTEFELRHIAAVRNDLDAEYDAKVIRSDRPSQLRFPANREEGSMGSLLIPLRTILASKFVCHNRHLSSSISASRMSMTAIKLVCGTI